MFPPSRLHGHLLFPKMRLFGRYAMGTAYGDDGVTTKSSSAIRLTPLTLTTTRPLIAPVGTLTWMLPLASLVMTPECR